MSSAAADWVITVHRDVRIIEVRYPAAPTADALDRYEVAIRKAIREMNGEWDCLVDQRAMPVLSTEVSARIAELIAWARQNGMRHAARVVKRGSMATLQAKQLLREAQEEQHIFLTPEEAMARLRELAGQE